jgi:hypothetical protein
MATMTAKRRKPVNLYQRTNGSWTANMRIAGVQQQKSSCTKDDALLWLARMQQRRIAGDYISTGETLGGLGDGESQRIREDARGGFASRRSPVRSRHAP